MPRSNPFHGPLKFQQMQDRHGRPYRGRIPLHPGQQLPQVKQPQAQQLRPPRPNQLQSRAPFSPRGPGQFMGGQGLGRGRTTMSFDTSQPISAQIPRTHPQFRGLTRKIKQWNNKIMARNNQHYAARLHQIANRGY